MQRPTHLTAVIGLLVLAAAAIASAQESENDTPVPCSSAEHRQFDFWIGEWTVTMPDGTIAGSNRIESIMGGCALQENWTGAKGTIGTSLNIYSPRDGLWRQTWIDTTGTLLEINGGLRDGSMVMEGEMIGREGKPVQHRIAWTPKSNGTVSQVWDVSTDHGATWKSVFNGIYSKLP